MKKELKLICAACRGSGWLCDEHPTMPWDHDHDCDGVGIVCGCNVHAVAPHEEVFVVYDALDEGVR
jgi:hypothetical protein